ncbi:RIIa domain-containing protein 1-like [Halichondria panicea]|uniref:RIIa domain-containing protein 1-like n=1 Tax=Halichondria panicea TaxID=6063 RepID=UPI00312B908A
MELELQLETKLSQKPNLEPNDTTALTKEQQDKLNQHKVTSRIENEYYLRKHPELSVLISNFVSEVLLTRPAKIREFAAEYFTDPELSEKHKIQ